jgi:hypothetical protein
MSSYPALIDAPREVQTAYFVRGSSGVLALADRAVVVWLVVRTLAWTIVALTQPNPPLDTVEWLAWGHEWQLGYPKHPPLAAWVAEMAYRLTPGSFLGVYLTGYLTVAFAIFCVWRLARRLLPPRTALAAVFCLDGLVYLGPDAAEFNNQVLLIAFWALAIERFRAAATSDRPRDWLLSGLALGLALLCKYSALALALPLAAWWLWHNRPLSMRRARGPALAALAAAVVFLPHFVWLVRNDFPTLRYAAERTQPAEGVPVSYLSGVPFLLTQGLRLLPVLLILAPLLRPRLRRLDADGRRARSLLLAAVLGPVALHLAASLMGAQLRDVWGAPLWTFTGLLLVLCVKTEEAGRPRAWSRRLGVAVLTMALAQAALSNAFSAGLRPRPLRVHFPGALLAEEVTSRYEQRHGQPPAIIAGDWWLAGNVCCHAPHRPALYGSREPGSFGVPGRAKRKFLAPEPATRSGLRDADLNARGGVLVWDAGAFGEDIPPWLHERFPRAQCQRALLLPFHGRGGQKLQVGWAMVAPLAP